MSVEDEKGKQVKGVGIDALAIEGATEESSDVTIVPTVRCFRIEFLGDQERFAKSPNLAFMELNQFFVEHDEGGPYLGIITEKARYKIRLKED